MRCNSFCFYFACLCFVRSFAQTITKAPTLANGDPPRHITDREESPVSVIGDNFRKAGDASPVPFKAGAPAKKAKTTATHKKPPLYSCFPKDSHFPFNEDTRFCPRIIFKGKGKGDAVAKVRSALRSVASSMVFHHYIWFPDEECSVGLHKDLNHPQHYPVLSTPDYYRSAVCYTTKGKSGKPTIKTTCTEKDVQQKCVPLGSARLRILRRLWRSPQKNIKEGMTLRERSLPLLGAFFAYSSQFSGTVAKLMHHGLSYALGLNDRDETPLNCNVFTSMFVNEPQKLERLFNEAPMTSDDDYEPFEGLDAMMNTRRGYKAAGGRTTSILGASFHMPDI